MRRATLILATIAVAGVVVGAQAPPAYAHDHLVPKTVLKKGQRELQTGRRVAWDAVFHVKRPDMDDYLMTDGHWQVRQGCGGDQYANWSFHLKTGGS